MSAGAQYRIWANSLGERARPHDSGSGPCMPQKSSASRARPILLEHPSISSTVTVGNDVIADTRQCQLAESWVQDGPYVLSVVIIVL